MCTTKLKSEPLNPRSQITLRMGLSDRLLQPLDRQRVFPADVDIGGFSPDRVATDRQTLDQLVRVTLHDDPVLEGARLALIGVAAQILRLAGTLRHEAPFQPGWKSGSAATPQVGFFDKVDDLVRRVLIKRLRQSLIAAAGPVGGEQMTVRHVHVPQKDRFEHGPTLPAATTAARSTPVTCPTSPAACPTTRRSA